MITTSIIPTSRHVHVEFDVPQEYIGQDLEIIVQPKEAAEKSPEKKTMKDFRGILSHEEYLVLKAHTEQARREWDRDF